MKIVNNTNKRVYVRFNPDNGDRISIIHLFPKDHEKYSDFEIEDTDTLYIQEIKEIDEK
jgi:hypothetical protein